MKRENVVTVTLVAALLVVSMVVLVREMTRRAQRGGGDDVVAGPPLPAIPVETWTARIRGMMQIGAWEDLDRELRTLRDTDSERFRGYRLGYLHAHVLIELEQWEEAGAMLVPFLRPGDPLRDLALYHAARIEERSGEPADAALLRERLIFNHPDSVYRPAAIEEHLAVLRDDPPKLVAFVDRLASEVSDQLRRALQAEKVSALFGTGSRDQALDLGFRLLGEDVADDAAERAMNEILDAAGEVALSGEQLSLLAQTAHAHRHFRRAVDLLQKARENLPGYSERLHFLTARAWFWAEDYAKAEEEYVAAAGRARANQDKAELYHHAGRAAQLRGDLARAEEHFTRAIAVRGNFRATAASLIQRMRIRLEDQRYQAGLGDLRLLFRLFPRSGWVVDGAMSYVVSMVGAERSSEALRILPQIPEPALDDFDRAEMNYWTGRALESRAPLDALDHYLDVLNADVPTHYRHFVRARLRTPALAAETRKAIQRRRSAVRATMAAREWDQARRLQTEIVRLTANEDDGDLELLRKIYTEIPDYALAAEATPLRFPAFPTETEGESAFGRGGPKADGQDAEEERGRLLMAMGLYEEAAQAIPRIYPGNRMRGGLTRALALREAGELDLAVRAAEEVEENLPDDFVPELQPEMLRKLLYPEYFYPEIVEQSRTHQADPRLVLSIMREESRFDPRAKSPAGARGLLQFVILTAREIGLEIGLESISSEQLYDPGTIIGLGARYVGNLMKRFEQNRYATAAAYNAGPQQAELWRRLAAGEGDDFLFAAINFDETRNYVQKVMNSDFAYRKIYGE